MKLMSIAGARPNFMKVASITEAIRQHNDDTRSPRIDHVLVHTGQHYDEKLSQCFFRARPVNHISRRFRFGQILVLYPSGLSENADY